MSARSIHAILVAINLFWYQACRQTLGVLTVAMGQELGLSTKEKGWLIAAPSVGNIITQMFGSRVESALGARATIACAVLGLAIGCLLVPIACTASLKLGLLVLAAQGFVFGPMFPAHSVLLSRWLTPADRGPASAQGEIAMSIASMGAPLLIASLETYAGWRAGFYATGSVCLLYVGFGWLRLAASRPSDCAYITKEELALLSASSGEKPPIKTAKGAAVAPDATPTGAPASKVLLHPATLALFACHMAYNLTTLSINSWMPTYYAEVLSFPPEAAKLHLTLPHLTAMILKFGVSRVASRVRLSLGCSMLTTRRIMCAVGYLFTGTPMLFVPALSRSPPWMTTLCFCIALAGTGFHAEGFRANYLDVTRAHVGLVSGVGNCLSSVAAMVAPFIVGALVSHAGRWDPVWYCISACCALSTLIFCTFSSTTPVEEQLDAAKEKKSQ